MLTNAEIRNAKPGKKTKRLFDGGGLYLEVSPRGGKWWRFKYRFNQKEKRISLGVYPEVSLKEARERLVDERRLLKKGIDPSEFRKTQRSRNHSQDSETFEVVAREWFAKYSPDWVTSHSSRIIRRFERDIFPWLGNRPISAISAPEVLEAIRRIEQRGALETAHRALQNCSQVFRYAVATGKAERDPTVDLRGALPPCKPRHFSSVTEPEKVGALLSSLDNYKGTLVVQCALRLAPLVFVRPGELRHAEWKDINLETQEWRYIVTKTNTQQIVPLSRQAVAILNELFPLTGHGRYVFPSARNPKGDRPMSENAILAALRRMGIDKTEMTGHGFRAMARTILDEILGFRPDYIEHQLSHTVRDPTGRAYNRTAYLSQRHEMMQAWADYLDTLKSSHEEETTRQ